MAYIVSHRRANPLRTALVTTFHDTVNFCFDSVLETMGTSVRDVVHGRLTNRESHLRISRLDSTIWWRSYTNPLVGLPVSSSTRQWSSFTSSIRRMSTSRTRIL